MSVDANALERETLERKDRDELAKIAAALGGKVTTRTRKGQIIDLILELTGVTSAGDGGGDAPADQQRTTTAGASEQAADASERQSAETSTPVASTEETAPKGGRGAGEARRGDDKPRPDKAEDATDDAADDTPDDDAGHGDAASGGQRRRRRGRNRGGQSDEFTGEPIPVAGCLDLRDDGYGFLRVDGMLPSRDDCYVSVKLVRDYGLRNGDVIAGGSRPAFRNEKNPAILRIDTVNDLPREPGTERPLFEELTATFATEQLALSDGPDDLVGRAVDVLAPVGRGSRVLVAAPPRAGKTMLLSTVAARVDAMDDVDLMVVLIDERPEEISDLAAVVSAGTVYGSAFDAPPDDHVAMAELALDRARRIAEAGDDVVVIVDGLTRLARAAHASGHSSGRTLGGVDTNAITTAKRAFGAGRNLEEAGSVTIVATANVDTGSELDDAVFDAVAGAATTQIVLDRAAAERRSFPAIDVGLTSTRREELLVGEDGGRARDDLRRELAGLPDPHAADHADGLDTLLGRLRSTKSNADLL